MSQSAVRSTPAGRKAVRKPKTVSDVRLKTPAGDKVTVSSIDEESDTFADDFLYVFSKNVKAARGENKRTLGTPSGRKKKKI